MSNENGKAPKVGALLKYAVERGASDLIITAGSPPGLRIDGEIAFLKTGSLTREDTKALLYSVLTPQHIESFERTKEVDFSISFGESRFRGNGYFQRGASAMALRPIPTLIPQIDDLGLPPMVKDLARASQGLVLITGPTGHGKSTTQAAMIALINRERHAHIVTVEDPIEFLHTNDQSIIDQREVGDDTLSFASALRHVLRQDPDVILIGEMRDPETIAAALTAAETGHLVISTLHTNDAVQSVDRIIDSFPPSQQSQVRVQLASGLLAVVSQRLIPNASGQGRLIATEIMRSNMAVANLIREGRTHQIYGVMETHAKDGMHTLEQSVVLLFRNGVISYQDASRLIANPAALG